MGTKIKFSKFLEKYGDVLVDEEDIKRALNIVESAFKEGDKVYVRGDLILGNEYSGLTFTTSMEEYKATVQTIKMVDSFSSEYRINDCPHWFTDEMLLPVKNYDN